MGRVCSVNISLHTVFLISILTPMKRSMKLARETHPVISNQWGFLSPGCWYFAPISYKIVVSFSSALVTSSEISSEFNSSLPAGNSLVEKNKDVFFILESQFMLQTERWSSALSSSRRTPWTYFSAPGYYSQPITPHLTMQDTATTHADSRKTPRGVGFILLGASCRVLIMLLLLLVFYRSLIWVNEAMCTLFPFV